MGKRYSAQDKRSIVEKHQKGMTVSELSCEIGIPKSTLYSWTKAYCPTVTETGVIFTPRDFDNMKRRLQKLESMIQVLQTVKCTASAPLAEKLENLELLHGQFSVHVLCEALNVSRGTYYNFILRNKRNDTIYTKRREDLKIEIQDIFNDNGQIFGAAKIRAILLNKGYPVSVKMVTELMREMGLYSVRTTSKKTFNYLEAKEKKANILKRNFHTDSPNLVWVSDITCFKFRNKYYYICIILDIFSRKVIAHKTSLNKSTHLVTSAFKQAYNERMPEDGLKFHSDRGTQFVSYAFQKLLNNCGVTQSFSNTGKPHDNAVAEAFFSSLKQEEIYRGNYHSEEQLKKGISKYIAFYNSKRPHAYLNYKTPENMEESFT